MLSYDREYTTEQKTKQMDSKWETIRRIDTEHANLKQNKQNKDKDWGTNTALRLLIEWRRKKNQK